MAVNKTPYLEVLLQINRARAETLKVGIYFIIRLSDRTAPTHLSQMDMADTLDLKQSNISRAIKELVEAKFVQKRTIKSNDRRKNFYKLIEPSTEN